MTVDEPRPTTAGEAERIRTAYRRRNDTRSLLGYESLAHVQRLHERYRRTLMLLGDERVDIGRVDILDVGCGTGSMLLELLQWGARGEQLTGVDLRADAIEQARAVLPPSVDLRTLDASVLPWSDCSFDLIWLSTVMSSILDPAMRTAVAAECLRVLRPGGYIVWYDLRVANPKNPDVRPVSKRALGGLFPSTRVQLESISLAPPIARRLPRRGHAIVYDALASIGLLRTHTLALIQKKAMESVDTNE